MQSHVTDEGALDWLEGAKDALTWLSPEDIAASVAYITSQPAHVNFQQVTIVPTGQAA